MTRTYTGALDPSISPSPSPPSVPAAASDEYNPRSDSVIVLMNVFKLERTVYLIVTSVSVFILLGCAVVLMAREGMEPAVIGLFGSSGGVMYSGGRLLRMFNEAIKMIQGPRTQ